MLNQTVVCYKYTNSLVFYIVTKLIKICVLIRVSSFLGLLDMNLFKYLTATVASILLCSQLYAAGEYKGERNAFNRFHGEGTYKYTNGNVYSGEWVDGRKNGQGKQTWANGDVYEGGWSNNREHGVGTKTWSSGSAYSGEWLLGKMSGEGEFKSAKGDMYRGAFIADQKQGKGVLTEARTGIKYKGTWRDDKKEGDFVVSMKNGLVAKGVWRAGQPPASASVVLPGGELYSGPVANGYLPSGKGTCTSGGKSSPCLFNNGKREQIVAAKPKPVVAPKPKPAPKPVVKTPPKVPAVKPAPAVVAEAPKVVAKPKPQPKVAPKPKNPRTLRGARTDGSQFFFKHSWGGFSSNIPQLTVEKSINDFGGMRISAKGGEFDVVFTIDEYLGPGTYPLKYFKASIQKEGESTSYRTSSAEPGELKIIEDDDGMLIGLFSFTGYPYGNVGKDKRVISEGEFAIPLK